MIQLYVEKFVMSKNFKDSAELEQNQQKMLAWTCKERICFGKKKEK